MADLLDSTGLQVKSRTDLVADLTAGFKAIYGSDINLDSNSPDAQLVQIFAQGGVDLRELLVAVYNSFDPDRAIGRTLDARCAINGVYRNAGTYSTVVVSVTVDRALTLPGLSDFPTSGAFTVSDLAGTKWSLGTTTPISNGSYPYTTTLTFQAVTQGAVTAAANALTFITTPTLGVLSVNNSASATVGTDEETDASLRLRRQKALAIPAKGSYESLLSAVTAVDNVTQAVLYENTTNVTDANGVAPHGVWLIVNGGVSAEIAAAAYARRPLGTPMQGSVTVNITQVDGSTFPLKFDRPTAQLLYVSYSIASSNGATVDYKGLGYRLLTELNATFSIGSKADATTVVALLKGLQSNILVTSEGVSLSNSGYTSQVAPSSVANLFYVSDQSVYINGTKLALL
jgi:uncharacterized phage protein gp47/JayE